jgi:transitional endoplasmic reticulum ATPase
LFLDNFEAIGTKRNLNDDSSSGVHERVLSTLLNEMDGIVDSTGVVFLACTNQPWDLDDALLRPGRIDHKIYIPLPEESDRLAILQLLANKSQIQMSDEEYQTLVDKSNGQTPALLNCAFRKAETNSNAKIEHAHLVQALDELMQRYQPPSVTKFITFGDR